MEDAKVSVNNWSPIDRNLSTDVTVRNHVATTLISFNYILHIPFIKNGVFEMATEYYLLHAYSTAGLN